jgi:hypothetical protein
LGSQTCKATFWVQPLFLAENQPKRVGAPGGGKTAEFNDLQWTGRRRARTELHAAFDPADRREALVEHVARYDANGSFDVGDVVAHGGKLPRRSPTASGSMQLAKARQC